MSNFRQFDRRRADADERARTRFPRPAIQTENLPPASTRPTSAGLLDPIFKAPPISENDPKRLAQIADEVVSEGRRHVNTRPQRHE